MSGPGCLSVIVILQTHPAMLTDCQGSGDAAISPLATAWSWGGSLTAMPARFSCLKAAVFADWTAGVVTPTPGGQLIRRLPCRVWVMVAQHCRLHWAADRDELDPWREERATTIRKMIVTLLQVSAVITVKGQWHPSAGGVSMPPGRKACVPSPPPPHPLRLCPWRCCF